MTHAAVPKFVPLKSLDTEQKRTYELLSVLGKAVPLLLSCGKLRNFHNKRDPEIKFRVNTVWSIFIWPD